MLPAGGGALRYPELSHHLVPTDYAVVQISVLPAASTPAGPRLT